MKAIKAETKSKVAKMESKEIRQCNTFSKRERPPMDDVVKKLGQKDLKKQEWLVLTPRDKMPQPEKEFFPRPPKREDGSYIYERIPGYAGQTPTGPGSGHHHHPQMLYKKRAYEEAPQRDVAATGTSSGAGPSSSAASTAKIQRTTGSSSGGGGMGQQRAHVPNMVPPKGRVATLTRIAAGSGGQRQVISWMDAPDDVFYKATPVTKRLRKGMPTGTLKKAARKPFKKVLKLPGSGGEA